MPITCLEDLLKLGWSINGDKGYIRPDKRVVSRKRQLSLTERNEYGDILFPIRPRLNQLMVSESPAVEKNMSQSQTISEPLMISESTSVMENDIRDKVVLLQLLGLLI